MSAGTFIIATWGKTDAELRAADPAKAGRHHGIPAGWAAFYLQWELIGRGAAL